MSINKILASPALALLNDAALDAVQSYNGTGGRQSFINHVGKQLVDEGIFLTDFRIGLLYDMLTSMPVEDTSLFGLNA